MNNLENLLDKNGRYTKKTNSDDDVRQLVNERKISAEGELINLLGYNHHTTGYDNEQVEKLKTFKLGQGVLMDVRRDSLLVLDHLAKSYRRKFPPADKLLVDLKTKMTKLTQFTSKN